MSGSGGGGYAPPSPDCAALSFTTILGSPKVPVLAGLKPGDVLRLEVQKGATLVVIAKNVAGDLAGTITTQAQKLIECMEEAGQKYEADVKEIKGAHCTVRVRPK